MRLCRSVSALLLPLAGGWLAVVPVAGPARAAGPAVGPGTRVLDHASYLSGVNDPGWYEANIPFVDLRRCGGRQQVRSAQHRRLT